jgi:hypothetical protein
MPRAEWRANAASYAQHLPQKSPPRALQRKIGHAQIKAARCPAKPRGTYRPT